MSLIHKKPDIEGAYDLFRKQNEISEGIIESLIAMTLDNQKMMLELTASALIAVNMCVLSKDEGIMYADLCKDARQLAYRYADIVKEYNALKDQKAPTLTLADKIFKLSKEITVCYFERLMIIKHKGGLGQ